MRRPPVDGRSRCTCGLHQRFTGDLPAAALAVIDPAKLSWVEQIDFDLDRATATSRARRPTTTPTGSAARAATRSSPTATRPAGAGLDGELKVRMPLVGGKVEGALVSGLREHADAEAALIASRLAD